MTDKNVDKTKGRVKEAAGALTAKNAVDTIADALNRKKHAKRG